MKELNIYCKRILEIVCEDLEIDCLSVLNGKKTHEVDARSIYITLLSERLSIAEISRATGWSPQLVSKLKNDFEKRLQRWSVRKNYDSIREKVLLL